MPLVKVKPTSAGRRALIKVVNHDLHKGEPVASLVESQKRGSGRNNNGHITMRHKGGGHKHHYRIVDFRRNKDGIAAKVERLEYDPNRSANIALLLYTDGERRYIIAPRGIAVGAQLMSGVEAPMKPVDHPMGGRTNGGGGWHHPMSPWGTPAKGYKTRKNKRTDTMIVRRRHAAKG